MNWLSESVEVLYAMSAAERQFDVVVVGSGYGGAVAARRLAEAGLGVCLLERGSEWHSGEFPSDLSQLGKYVRAESSLGKQVDVMGYEDALFDLRVGNGVSAIVGNGLGGGSLINAGVGLVPDQEVFAQTGWPQDIRTKPQQMRPWFRLARRTLGLQLPASPANRGFDTRRTAKYAALKSLSDGAKRSVRGKDGLKVSFRPVPIAVHLRPDEADHPLGARKACNGCGNCVTGCNHDAKLSLTKSYLPAAKLAGARMFTRVSVLRVARDEADTNHPWVVQTVRTPERGQLQRLVANGHGSREWGCTVRAARVVLAAGTFGTTEILMRSRPHGGKPGLALSSRLGTGISGNGDDIAAVAGLAQAADTVGDTAGGPMQGVGPTITSMVRFKSNAHRDSTLLQDAAIPGLLGGVFEQLVQTLGHVVRLERFRMPHPPQEDPLAIGSTTRTHTLTLLGMGHDNARAEASLDSSCERLAWTWPDVDEEQTPAAHQARSAGAAARAFRGSIYIRNPATGVLPKTLSETLQGPRSNNGAKMLVTVHPLGGCRMADSAALGVCDHMGRVFRADRGNDSVYEGLFVMDGSIVPSSLGVNPLLTITALAERACADIVRGRQPAAPLDVHIGRRPIMSSASMNLQGATQPGVVMSEVLRGTLSHKLATASDDLPSDSAAALFVRMRIDDWGQFFRDFRHEARVVPANMMSLARYAQSRLVVQDGGNELILQATDGMVSLYAARRDGFWRHLGAALRLALTYWIGRWHPDRYRPRKLPPEPKPGLLARPRNWLHLRLRGAAALWHAAVVRTFHYRIELERADDAQKQYLLIGTKVIDSAARLVDFRRWWVEYRQGRWPAVHRRSVWEQLTEMDVQLFGPDQQLMLEGRLRMDMPDIIRNLMPVLGPQRDALTALVALAGYPLLMARGLIQTRMFDFRAPDYKRFLPEEDRATRQGPLDVNASTLRPFYPTLLLLNGNRRRPRIHCFDVPERVTLKKGGGCIRLALVHYAQPRQSIGVRADGSGPGIKLRAALLINGFAQNTVAFVAPEMKGNGLAERLHRAGWDVWMLEYRVSPFLPASARFSTMDDIAAFDIPRAVDLICNHLGRQLDIDPARLRLYVFSHCVGSASLAMSLAQGSLVSNVETVSGKVEEVPRVAAAVFSQFHPFVIGSNTAQQRLQFGSFLRNLLGRDSLNFTAGQAEADGVHAVIDRIMSSVWRDDERCPGEADLRHWQTDTTTCRRMTGLLSGLYSHQKLGAEIHRHLDNYFGRTNLGVFLHGAKCVQAERLVDYDGRNYIFDEALKKYFDMPIMLMHGSDNRLFSVESLQRTTNQFRRAFGLDVKEDAGADAPLQRITSRVFEGHQHFDCTIGNAAATAVFPEIEGFLDRAWHEELPVEKVVRRTLAVLPRLGPIIGWVREERGAWRVRVWAEFDVIHSATPMAAVVVLSYSLAGATKIVRLRKPIKTEPLNGERIQSSNRRVQVKLVYLSDDVDVPVAATGVSVYVLGVYSYVSAGRKQSAGGLSPGDGPGPSRLKAPRSHSPKVGPGVPLSLKFKLLGSPRAKGRRAGVAHDSRNRAADAALPREWPEDWGAPLTVDEVRPDKNVVELGPLNVISDEVDLGAADATKPEPAGDGAGAAFEPMSMLASDSRATNEDLSQESLDALLDALEAYLDVLQDTSMRADPDTLSVLMRSERGLDDVTARLPDTLFAADSRNAGVRFLAAGCRHPGITSFEQERADETLKRLSRWPGFKSARLFTMLGDQVYLDARAGVFDVASNLERIVPRYQQAFGSPGFRAVATRVPLTMVLDDHELVDGWTRERMSGGAGDLEHARLALAAFRVYQRAHGPDPQPARANDGYDYMLKTGSVDMFVLDSRSQRKLLSGRKIMSQEAWVRLESWLDTHVDSPRPKWIVSGTVIAPGLQEGRGYPPPRDVDTWQFAAHERKKLLKMIHAKGMPDVVLLSCDYHCSACATITLPPTQKVPSGLTVLAIVAPPLHAPLRFANSEASTLLRYEEIELDGIGKASVKLDQAWDGDGWLACTQEPDGAGWRLALDYHLQPLEGQAHQVSVTYHLPGNFVPKPMPATTPTAPACGASSANVGGTLQPAAPNPDT